MVKERKGLIERLRTRRTLILREPLIARLEKRRGFSAEETEGSLKDWDKVIGTSSSSKESVTSEKSTYQLFVEKASRELAEAKDHLRRYAETTECGWCKAKAEGLAKMTEQLEALTPLAQEFSEKVGALEAEELQKLSEEITQIREWLGNAAGNPANKFHVRYIDQTTGKTVEKTIPSIEQYELYRLQREGKISIIEIHTIRE